MQMYDEAVVEVVVGLIEIVDCGDPATTEIVQQFSTIIEVVEAGAQGPRGPAGPQGPAGRDGALSPEIPIVINGGFF